MGATETREKKILIAGAGLLILLGLAARFVGVMAAPLWLDEAYSAFAAVHGFDFLWHVVPRYETHPPFYYSLLHVWTLLAGDSRVALRLPGVIAGLVTPIAVIGAARAAGRLLGCDRSRRHLLAFVAFGFACLSIPLVEMSREVRPYPLMILCYALLVWTLLALRRRSARGEALAGRAYAAYLVLILLLLWLHNLGALFAFAGGVAVLAAVVRRGMAKADWAWLLSGHALVLLLWLPALAILREQTPTWVSSTWLRFAWSNVPGKLAVLYAVPGWQGFAAVLLLILAVAAMIGRGWRVLAMLAALAVIPVALSIALSAMVAPIFIMRTMTPVAVPALLLMAIGATAGAGRRRLIGLGLALIVAVNMLAVDIQARAGPPFQDWYGTVDWLARRFRPGDQVFAYPNEGALPLSRALRDKGLDYPIRSIPAPVPAFDQGGWFPTGSRGVVSLPRDRLRAIAQQPETRAVPTIWLLRLGPETYDPGNVFLNELHRDRIIVRSWRDGPIDIVGLRRRDLVAGAPR